MDHKAAAKKKKKNEKWAKNTLKKEFCFADFLNEKEEKKRISPSVFAKCMRRTFFFFFSFFFFLLFVVFGLTSRKSWLKL